VIHGVLLVASVVGSEWRNRRLVPNEEERMKTTRSQRQRRIKMRKRLLVLVAGIAAIGGLVAVPASAVSSAVVKIHPSNMHGWTFINDATEGPGSGQLVTGPATPPLGVGSVQLSVTGPADRQIIATPAYSGTRLADITSLDYWSYQSGPTLAIALQFDVRYRPTDTAYGGRLVFEPYQTVGVVAAGWQHWNPLAGKWWASKTTPAGSNGLCAQATPCTWAQVNANWPQAAIRGNLLLKAGGGWPASTFNADALTVGVSGNSTTFDFEPEVTFTNADQCTNGGWKNSNNPTFASQDACENYFPQSDTNGGPDDGVESSAGHQDH
jgi:hypothetical protein